MDFLTLNVIEHSMHINIMTKQEELARNIVTKTNDIRVICTTVHQIERIGIWMRDYAIYGYGYCIDEKS